MSFHKTNNVPYQMVYSSETEREYTDMYSMLPELNNLDRHNSKLLKENQELREFLSECWEMLSEIYEGAGLVENDNKLFRLVEDLRDKPTIKNLPEMKEGKYD